MEEEKEPFLNCRFRVEIKGIKRTGYSEVTIFHARKDWVEYKEGAHPRALQQLDGLERFGVITLKTGVTGSMELSNWYHHFASKPGVASKINARLIILDASGNDAVRFNLKNVWPAKYAVGPMDAKGNDVLYESLDIVFETLERIA